MDVNTILKFIDDNNHISELPTHVPKGGFYAPSYKTTLGVRYYQKLWIELYYKYNVTKLNITRQLGRSVIFGYLMAYESRYKKIHIYREYKDVLSNYIMNKLGDSKNITNYKNINEIQHCAKKDDVIFIDTTFTDEIIEELDVDNKIILTSGGEALSSFEWWVITERDYKWYENFKKTFSSNDINNEFYGRYDNRSLFNNYNHKTTSRDLIIDLISGDSNQYMIITEIINKYKKMSKIITEVDNFYILNDNIIIRENDEEIFINRDIHNEISDKLKINIDIDNISKIYKLLLSF